MDRTGACVSDPEDELKAHTRARVAEMGMNAASNLAEREARRALKARIPRMFWPLIPGESGSVEANVEKAARRKLSDWIWTVGCTVGFFLVFGGAVLGVAAIVLYAFWSSGHLF